MKKRMKKTKSSAEFIHCLNLLFISVCRSGNITHSMTICTKPYIVPYTSGKVSFLSRKKVSSALYRLRTFVFDTIYLMHPTEPRM